MERTIFSFSKMQFSALTFLATVLYSDQSFLKKDI